MGTNMLKTQLEEAWDSIHFLNKHLQEELTQYEIDTEKEQRLTRELFFQKREAMMTIWNLEKELKGLHDARLDLWSEKKNQITDLIEKSEELNIRITCKQHVLEELAAQLPVYDGDVPDKNYCDELFYNIQGQMNQSFGSNTLGTNSNSTKSIEDVNGPAIGTYSEPLPERPVADPVPVETQLNAYESDPVIIRDFNHLYRLKMYLLRKCDENKSAKTLKKLHPEGFNEAVIRFCDTALHTLTKESQTLTSDLSLPTPKITAHFEAILESNMCFWTKDAYLLCFKRLLRKYTKNEDSTAKKMMRCSAEFFQKFRRGKVRVEIEAQLEAARLQYLDMLKEKIHLAEILSRDLQARCTTAEDENEDVRKTRVQVEGDLGLLRILLSDAEDNLRDDTESFRVLFEEQDREILRLKSSIQDLEANIELKDLSIEFIANGLNRNPLSDSICGAYDENIPVAHQLQ